jgi:hypothetical protein
MPRTNLPVTVFTPETTVPFADPAGTAVDQANGMNIAIQAAALDLIPANPDATNLVVRVNNTGASPFNFIVRAGVMPPSMRQLLGDLTVSITNATTKWVGPFDAGRHAQVDGSINVDFGAGFTGTITAFLVPRSGF